MSDPDGFAQALARLLASVINPLFVVLLFAVPASRPRVAPKSIESKSNRIKWLARCFIGIALPVVLAESGKRYQVWNGHPSFPSGHETFAASAATCLIVGNPRLAPVALALAAAMAWALVRAGYHDSDDVIGALVLGPLCAVALLVALRARTPN